MSASWKLTLPCTKAEAEAIAASDAELDAVLLTTEEDEAAGRWRLDAYFEGEPDAETLAAVRALAQGADIAATPEPVPDADWVTMSQAGLEPLAVGRFVVHTGTHDVAPPPGGRAFRIDAGRAFGTGHHETTAGCLAALDAMAQTRVTRAIDVGTGTGLLAFAAAEIWPEAVIIATDNDPVAIEVTAENVALNGFAPDRFTLLVADGAFDPGIEAHAPYDLVIANILAGPLIAMAPELAAIAAPGGTILLAGLLAAQREAVVGAYADCGCSLAAADPRGDWAILTLRASAKRIAATASQSRREDWLTEG